MAHALFIVLNEVELLDDLLEVFVEIGVSGATIIDSQGMAKAILDGKNRNLPLFGSLKTFFSEARSYSKTIFTVLDSEETADKVASQVCRIVGDAGSRGAGFVFSVPIGKVYPIC